MRGAVGVVDSGCCCGVKGLLAVVCGNYYKYELLVRSCETAAIALAWYDVGDAGCGLEVPEVLGWAVCFSHSKGMLCSSESSTPSTSECAAGRRKAAA
jgi:hypothetical protein